MNEDAFDDRIRRMLQARADALPVEPQEWPPVTEVEVRRRRPVHLAVFAGAAAMLAAVLATVFVTTRDTTQQMGPTPPGPSTAAPPPSTSPEAISPVTDPAPAVASNAGGWYVPTSVPDGFEIVSASANRPPLAANPTWQLAAWIDRTDGRIDRRLQVSSLVPQEGPGGYTFDHDPGATIVRGVAGSISEADGVTSVSWNEAGRMLSASGTMDRERIMAIVEAGTVEAESGFRVDDALLPPGVEHVLPAEPGEPLDLLVTTSLLFEGQGGATLWMTSTPNEGGLPLDGMYVFGPVRRETVGGIEREIATSSPDHGDYTSVSWLDGGSRLAVSGTGMADDELLAFARGVSPSDEATFLDLEREVTDRWLREPATDEATFADGLAVSVRSSAPADAVDPLAGSVLCAEAITRLCAAPIGGAGGGNGAESASAPDWYILVGTFEVDGRKTAIAWLSGEPGDIGVTTNDPERWDPLPFERADGQQGVFVRVDVESALSMLKFSRNGGSGGANVAAEVFDVEVMTR